MTRRQSILSLLGALFSPKPSQGAPPIQFAPSSMVLKAGKQIKLYFPGLLPPFRPSSQTFLNASPHPILITGIDYDNLTVTFSSIPSAEGREILSPGSEAYLTGLSLPEDLQDQQNEENPR